MRIPSRETRPGNPVLLVVLIVLSLVMTSVYFREANQGGSGPLHSTRRGVLYLSAPFARLGDVVSTPFNSVGDWFSGFRVSRQEMDKLKQQNDEMRARLATLEEQKKENARLTTLLKVSELFPGKSVVARVIGRPTDSWEGVVMIDRGSGDRVTTGTPVVAGQGLLGKVIDVAPNSSKVRLITDQSSGVAVLVQSSRATGVVRGSVDGKLSLDFVDPKRPPKVGDVVITSGDGGAYPKSLVVGDVTAVSPDPSGLYPKVEVTSRVPIGDIEEVAVLVGVLPSQVVGGVE
jgi:rod shape-determining protein MreC